jgi:uncharacterized protein (TIGR00369 family)
MVIMTPDDLHEFLDQDFPQLRGFGHDFVVEEVFAMGCRTRLGYHERHIRPGGTLSGPAMFTLADVTMYVAILAQIGPSALTVTTNLTMNFLRKPAQRDMLAVCTLLKLGKRLAICEARLYSDGSDALIAHATGTYSIPQPSLEKVL